MPLKTPGTSAAPVVTKTPTSATTTPATGATPAKQTTAQPHKPVQSFPATSPSTPIFGSASGNASATKPTTVTASPSAATVAVKPAKKVKLPPNPKAEVDDDVWRCVQCDCPGNLTPIKRIGKSGKRDMCNACYIRVRTQKERDMRGRARPQMNALPTGARTASTLLQGLQLASPGVDAATAAGWAALDPAGMMQQFMAFQAQTSGQQQQQQQQLYGDASSFAADQAAFGTGFQVPLTFDATQLQLGDEDGSAAAFDNATTAFNDGRPFATESASVPAVLDTKRRKSSEDGDKRNVRAKHDVNVTTAYPYDPATDASSPRVAKHTPVVAVGHDGNGRKRGGQGM